jgi:hypothetical protein
MHIRADGFDRCPPSGVQVCCQQASQARLRPVGRQAHHLAVDQIRKYRAELLAFPAVNFIGDQMPRPPFRAGTIPFGQERPLCSPRFTPAHPMPDGGMAVGID